MKIGIIAAMPERLVYLAYLENAQEETVLVITLSYRQYWFNRACLDKVELVKSWLP